MGDGNNRSGTQEMKSLISKEEQLRGRVNECCCLHRNTALGLFMALLGLSCTVLLFENMAILKWGWRSTAAVTKKIFDS
jgi:hypothetical protein